MFKVYKNISAYPIIRIASGNHLDKLTVRGSITTDDPHIQELIENSGSFKKTWIRLDEALTAAANEESVSESDIEEVVDLADPDEVVPAEPGKIYAMSDLLKMKVPQLRGILTKMNVKYSGLNKQALIQSILNGKRCE